MRIAALVLLSSAGVFVSQTNAGAGPLAPWKLPRDRDCYLMEDDLVYARFLTLSRGGTYRQINRDERGSIEVDRGNWEQDAAGTLRLHSSCRALRPRALSAGMLSVTLADDAAFAGLPTLLDLLRHLLAAYHDDVFGAETMAELNTADAPAVHLGVGAATFDRRDAAALVARIKTALASERDAVYLLEPLKNDSRALFAPQGGVFGAADLPEVRRVYHIIDRAVPPFYFARVEAKIYAVAIGRWQPLGLPGGAQ